MLTLGINYSQMHDSSACVVRDGELLFPLRRSELAAEADLCFPQLAIQSCWILREFRAEQLG